MGTELTVTEDTMLYARWEKEAEKPEERPEATITFDADGGEMEGGVLFGKLSAPTFFTLNAPVFQMVWINIQNFCICLRSFFKVSIV